MRNVNWLAAAALAVSTTGCVETYGDPTTSYGGYPSGYGYSSGYYSQPAYYQPPPYSYYPSGPTYRSASEYRNYNGIHPGPEYYP